MGKQVGLLARVQGLLLPLSFYEKVAGPQVVEEQPERVLFWGGAEDGELMLQTTAGLT